MRSIIQLWIVQSNVQQNTLYLVMNFTMYCIKSTMYQNMMQLYMGCDRSFSELICDIVVHIQSCV